MKLTIAYMTFRLRPRFEWFSATLAREFRSMPDVARSDVQIMVIDGRLPYDGDHRRLGLLDACGGRFAFEHHGPKPTIWQGPHRLTTQDYFCAANARNTALCYARAPHVAFVDDLSALRPGWLKAHWHALDHGYVLAGSTNKVKNLQVSPDGTITFAPFAPGTDSRLRVYGPGLNRTNGGSLFGGTFSVPLELALGVNGQDEICDGIGAEDYDFGIRLERAGGIVNFSSDCATYEDEDGHHTEAPMKRLDKRWPIKGEASGDGYTSNYLLDRLTKYQPLRVGTIGNDYQLRDLRTHVLAGGEFPIPVGPLVHWVDGQPLSEM